VAIPERMPDLRASPLFHEQVAEQGRITLST